MAKKADVKTERGIKSAEAHEEEQTAAATAAEESKAERIEKRLHNVYQVDYLVRSPSEPGPHAGPDVTRTGSIRLAAVCDEDIPAALAEHVGVGKRESLETASVRTLLVDVHTHSGRLPKPSSSRSKKDSDNGFDEE